MTGAGRPEVTTARQELDVWAGRDLERLRAEWQLPALVALRSTPSTNDVARRMAEAGAAHGTTVLADHQTAGRGRHGRVWSDRPAASLLLSMVLRPAHPGPQGDTEIRARATEPAVLPLLVGLACAHAIRALCSADVRIEWPNDLVVDDLKLGGVLCEAALHAGAVDFVVAGIGINVQAVPNDLDADTRAAATCLASVGGSVDRASLAAEVVRRLARLRADSRLEPAELAELRRLDALAGRRVRLGTGTEGVALGILADGALELDQGGGARLAVRAGSVSPVDTRV